MAQTGRLLENIGELLKEHFPYVPRIILEARVCRPEWLIEMECEAE